MSSAEASLSRRQLALVQLAIACAILLSVVLGARTVNISHANGDQRVYVGMAMKLERFGTAHYDIRGVGMRGTEEDSGRYLIYYPQFEGSGDLLLRMRGEGVPFYDQPLMHAPPLYSTLIWGLHRVQRPSQGFAVLAVPNTSDGLRGWLHRLQSQGYAILVSWLCAPLLVWLATRFGTALGGAWTGAISAWLVAPAPILILASQRVWADTLLATLLCAAVLLADRTRKSGRLRDALLTGCCLGFALLTKNNAVIVAVPIAMLLLVGVDRSWRNAAIVGFSAFAIALPWYIAAIQAFGVPMFNPSQPGIAGTHPWFAFINERPWYTFLLGIPYQNPLLLLGILSGPFVIWRANALQRALIAWAIAMLVILSWACSQSEMLGPDHRYMLPLYPALAGLSALKLLDFARRLPHAWRAISLVTVTLLHVGWALRLATLHWDADLILAPF